MSTVTPPGLLVAKLMSALRRVTHAMFAPESGLTFTWVALMIASSAMFGPLAASIVLMGGLTVILLMMASVAAYMPPTRPFRELSALTARTADLIKVSSGAALFGAAAAYGGIVGELMSRMTPEEMSSPHVVWGVTWPVLLSATTIGASVVGVRLGWDFRFSRHRVRLVALGKLRSWVPSWLKERAPITGWLAHVFLVSSRSGVLMIVGYLTPVIVAGDIYLGIELARLVD